MIIGHEKAGKTLLLQEIVMKFLEKIVNRDLVLEDLLMFRMDPQWLHRDICKPDCEYLGRNQSDKCLNCDELKKLPNLHRSVEFFDSHVNGIEPVPYSEVKADNSVDKPFCLNLFSRRRYRYYFFEVHVSGQGRNTFLDLDARHLPWISAVIMVVDPFSLPRFRNNDNSEDMPASINQLWYLATKDSPWLNQIKKAQNFTVITKMDCLSPDDCKKISGNPEACRKFLEDHGFYLTCNSDINDEDENRSLSHDQAGRYYAVSLTGGEDRQTIVFPPGGEGQQPSGSQTGGEGQQTKPFAPVGLDPIVDLIFAPAIRFDMSANSPEIPEKKSVSLD